MKNTCHTRAATLLLTVAALLLSACAGQRAESHFRTIVLNRYTPIKDQGQTGCCWAYAMLAAIETEHIMRGDSVNLSPAFIIQAAGRTPGFPRSLRGTGQTLLNMMQREGMVPYDAMRDTLRSTPHWAFMLGAQYTLQEFARSVCAPGEYAALAYDSRVEEGRKFVLDVADNWERDSFINTPVDSMLSLCERAVRGGHGVCWEGELSSPGFDREHGVADTDLGDRDHGTPSDDHCMAVVGLALDEQGRHYFIMKNSWGEDEPGGGLVYMSYNYFRKKTVALFLPYRVL